MGYARGFERGMRIGKGVMDTYQTAKQQAEFDKIATAKPEESQGFTADQGDELRRAAESGQYNIGYDEQAKAYTVTPKADPTQTGMIAQRGVTDFLGSRTAGTMNDGQVDSARQRAMAGVLMKTDPVRGMAMMRDVKQGERDDQRWDRQTKQWDRDDKTNAEADADKALMKDLDGKVGEWFKGRLTNPDGTQRQATVDDHLGASQFRAAQLMAAGKTDAAGQVLKDYNAQSLVKIQLETAQRDTALAKASAALASGDLQTVADFYNQYIPDGARVTGIEKGPKGEIVVQRESLDGRPMPPRVMKDIGEMSAALSSFKDPMAVYNWSQNEFKNNLLVKADQRADRADNRAANKDKREQTESDAKTAAALALFQEQNPNATPAQLEAAKRGILSPSVPGKGEKYTVEMGDVTTALGTPAVDRNGNPRMDPLTGRQQINRDPKKEAEFFQWMRDNNITDTNKGLAIFLGQKREEGAGKPAPIAKGAVVDGYEFLGGDPKDPKSWREVKQRPAPVAARADMDP
jgi:hypothetical protein